MRRAAGALWALAAVSSFLFLSVAELCVCAEENRKASFSPALLSVCSACVVVLPVVSMMGWFWFMCRSFVSWARVAKSVFMAFRSALFPLPLSPVMRTMSVGFMRNGLLS